MNAIGLGASLYVPAVNAAAARLSYGESSNLRSIVVCLEDSIRADEVGVAMARLQRLLEGFIVREPAISVYVRPRDVEMLTRICALPGVERIEGFVLPKVTTSTLPVWLSAVMHDDHRIMPTIEGEEAFDRPSLARLCDQLRPYVDRVAAVRIGGNDILGLLGIRRSRARSAYEGPLGNVIRDVAATFIPNGFCVAAPVFEHYSELDVLRQEVEQDIEHGLLTKSAIHPTQVEVIQEVYRPSAIELIEARRILDVSTAAVFGSNGSMCEPATHARWARSVIDRAGIHGVRGQICDPQAKVA
ncbi:HpcH/HpaI aldolase/citrate lyase family protein [Sphingomonas sp. R86521]|uniref:HpcH/HpaI aldolase/citrate lyase family protein n=1 Tax=Sphingomonas sp. R86521 TaxID=3093860 RepID=UPI0036D29D4F